jgi:hypothetical protein
MSPKVFMSAVLGTRTGGPEAVHQLVHALRERDIDTTIVPARGSTKQGPHSDYGIYDYELVDRIHGGHKNRRLIITEVSPLESWRELKSVPAEDTWLWWLSVNNAPDQRARYFNAVSQSSSIRGIPSEALRRARSQSKGVSQLRTAVSEMISLGYSQRLLNRDISYLAQSYYALNFCETQLGKPASLVTDYLRKLPDMNPGPVRSNMITYNGSRGYSLIDELRVLLPESEFIPISGMDYSEVCTILAESAAYVELGHLPGRDRLPREAGRLGTPVILLERGAGINEQDFPLPAQFRIHHDGNWARNVARQLEIVQTIRSEVVHLQANYRDWVEHDRARFEAEVDAWLPLLLK